MTCFPGTMLRSLIEKQLTKLLEGIQCSPLVFEISPLTGESHCEKTWRCVYVLRLGSLERGDTLVMRCA